MLRVLFLIIVGDYSRSPSERYVIDIGDRISHQSTQFGEIESGVYTLQPGMYTSTIRHIGTRPDLHLQQPDYDYTALIEPMARSKAKVTVIDPQSK